MTSRKIGLDKGERNNGGENPKVKKYSKKNNSDKKGRT